MSASCVCCDEDDFSKNSMDPTLCRNCQHSYMDHAGRTNTLDPPRSPLAVAMQQQQSPQRPTPKPRPRPTPPVADTTPANNRVVAQRDALERAYKETVGSLPDAARRAREIVDADAPLHARYALIDLRKILAENRPLSSSSDSHDNLPMVISAFDILEKYAVNLLKPSRPQFWRQIKFSNGVYQARVSCLKGSRSLLKAMGYTEEYPNGLAFPKHQVEPDVDVVARVAVELLIARIEVEALHAGSHPRPDSLKLPLWEESERIFPSPASSLPLLGQQRVFQSYAPGAQGSSRPVPAPRKRIGSSLSQTTTAISTQPEGFTSPVSQAAQVSTSQVPVSKPPISRPEPYESSLSPFNDPISASPARKTKQPYEPQTPFNDPAASPPVTKVKQNQQPEPKVLSPRLLDEPLISQGLPTPPVMPTSVPVRPFSGERPISSMSGSSNVSSSSVKFCSTCNEERPTGKFCSDCGSELTDLTSVRMLQCVNCGAERASGKFCSLCGGELVEQRKPEPVKEYRCSRCSEKCEKQNKFCSECGGYVILVEVETPSPAEPPLVVSKPMPEPESEETSDEWSCEFCTFLNPVGVIVCSMCCKTRREMPVKEKQRELKKQAPVEEPPPQDVSSSSPTGSLKESHSKLRNYVVPQNEDKALAPQGAVAGALSPTSPEIMTSERRFVKSEKAQSEKLGQLLQKKKIPPQSSEEDMQSPNSELGTSFQRDWRTGSQSSVASPVSGAQAMSGGTDKRKLSDAGSSGRVEYSKSKIKEEAREAFERKQKAEEEEARRTCEERQREEQRLRKRERIREIDLEFFGYLKDGEKVGYSPEEVEIGLKESSQNPIEWLKSDWEVWGKTVVDLARRESEKAHGRPWLFTSSEAKRQLINSGGDFEIAVERLGSAKEEQIKKVHEAMELSDEQSICCALAEVDGDPMQAVIRLQNEAFQEYRDRIWAQDGFSSDEETDNAFRSRKIPAAVGKLVDDKTVDVERRIRVLHAEYDMASYGRACVVIRLLDCDERKENFFSVQQAVKTARDHGFFDDALRHLRQTCPICEENYPELVTMPSCQDSLCRDCFQFHFTIAISERTASLIKCPICGMPDMENVEEVHTFFQFLNMQIHEMLDRPSYDMLQKKLSEHALMKDPNFRWCPHCKSGFINDNGVKRMVCPYCNKASCFECKREWLAAHEDISCDAFQRWLIDNDEDNQEAGLAAHLNQNGIDCPQCNFRFGLSKGGCMHFKCTQCTFEFCSGCSARFTKNCDRFESCKLRGFHAHHPRDCYSFLRDNSVPELQGLLQKNDIEYDIEVQQAQAEAAANAQDEDEGPVQIKCRVMEQKEVGGGLVDDECGRYAGDGYAGLCQGHYKEYLVHLINKNSVDPISILFEGEIEALLRREEVQIPPKERGETDEDYVDRLKEYVQEKMPLKKRDDRGVLHWDQ